MGFLVGSAFRWLERHAWPLMIREKQWDMIWLKQLLLGGLEHEFYDFPYIGNVIIPTDFHIFQRGRYPTNQENILKQLTLPSHPWFLHLILFEKMGGEDIALVAASCWAITSGDMWSATGWASRFSHWMYLLLSFAMGEKTLTNIS